jgi:hypothetical protein
MNHESLFKFFLIVGVLIIISGVAFSLVIEQKDIHDLNERCKKEGNISQSSPFNNGLERVIPNCCHEIDGKTYCLRLD